eukprot:TRINITY_DN310_c0_g1_i1.p1 TRINITY_DN310_c0_g1~~TRINITY_DN310_c0_g1_i1.p1  ORF type:complete len:394 (+),score=40.29 TRINITY_DN310_c0_g1_i1:127-1308(+)
MTPPPLHLPSLMTGNGLSFETSVSGILVAEKFGGRPLPKTGDLIMALSRDEYPVEPVIRKLVKRYPNIVAFILPSYYENHVPGEQEYTTDASDTSDITIQAVALELKVYDLMIEISTDSSLSYLNITSLQGQENPWRTLYHTVGFTFFLVVFVILVGVVMVFGIYVFVDKLFNRAPGVWWNLSNTITLLYTTGGIFRFVFVLDFVGVLHFYHYRLYSFLFSFWLPFVLSASFLVLLFWNIQVNSAGLHTKDFRIPAFVGVGTVLSLEVIGNVLHHGLMIDTYNIQLAIYFVLTVISLVFHFYVTIRMRNFVIAQEKALGFQVLYLRHTNNILLFNGFLTIANLLLALLVIIIGNSPNSKFLVAIVIGTNLVSEFLVFYILIMRKQSKYAFFSL